MEDHEQRPFRAPRGAIAPETSEVIYGVPDEQPNYRYKRWLLIGAILILLGVLVFFGASQYRSWRERRTLATGKAFLEKRDYQSAVLSARVVLASDPNSIAANEILAAVAKDVRSPNEVTYRQRLAQADPKTLSRYTEWALAACGHQDFAAAKAALDTVPENLRTGSKYFLTKADVLLASGNPREASVEYAKAREAEPENGRAKLNYWFAQSAIPETRAVALKELRSLASDSELEAEIRIDASRVLLSLLVADGKLEEALGTATMLSQQENAPFNDILALAEVQHRLDPKSKELEDTLSKLEAVARSDGYSAHELSKWMIAHQYKDRAWTLVQSLPEALREKPSFQAVLADLLMLKADWSGVLEIVRGKEWVELEALRLAIEARAEKELPRKTSQLLNLSQQRWKSALEAAKNQPTTLYMLASLGEQWGMRDGSTEALWQIARNGIQDAPAKQTLFNRLFEERDTRGLLKLFAIHTKENPKDQAALRYWAFLTLLTDPRSEQANEVAARLYREDPSRVENACTYALSLLSARKGAEALEVMEKTKPEDRQRPEIGCYYGLTLTAAGSDSTEAREYLNKAAAVKLLPEENVMVQSALEALSPK